MKVASQAKQPSKEVRSPDFNSIIWNYFGAAGVLEDGPQAYLVSMPDKGSSIPPHFHDVDQYQVVVGGSGSLGATPAVPVAFHYADAYTPYGPIVAGEKGLSFFTIRSFCASGHFGIPESRHLLPKTRGRNIAGQFSPDSDRATAGLPQSLVSAEDGLSVVGWCLKAGEETKGMPTDAGTQFYLVASGSLIHANHEHPTLSLMLIETGEPAPTLRAGQAGASVVLFQFPRPSDRIGSNPPSFTERKIGVYERPPRLTP